MKSKANFLLLGALFAVITAAATDWQTEGKRWWSHVEYLADDRLEGRDTGSEGHRKAAEYVAGSSRTADSSLQAPLAISNQCSLMCVRLTSRIQASSWCAEAKLSR